LLYSFHLVFTPNIQRLEKLNNQELSAIKGGRKEDEEDFLSSALVDLTMVKKVMPTFAFCFSRFVYLGGKS